MNLLSNLTAKLKSKLHKPLYPVFISDEIKETLAELDKPVPPKPKGRVIKQTRHSEFNPSPLIKGGRIVKVMPRKLQKIKQAQEKFENDGQQPGIEDLEE